MQENQPTRLPPREPGRHTLIARSIKGQSPAPKESNPKYDEFNQEFERHQEALKAEQARQEAEAARIAAERAAEAVRLKAEGAVARARKIGKCIIAGAALAVNALVTFAGPGAYAKIDRELNPPAAHLKEVSISPYTALEAEKVTIPWTPAPLPAPFDISDEKFEKRRKIGKVYQFMPGKTPEEQADKIYKALTGPNGLMAGLPYEQVYPVVENIMGPVNALGQRDYSRGKFDLEASDVNRDAPSFRGLDPTLQAIKGQLKQLPPSAHAARGGK